MIPGQKPKKKRRVWLPFAVWLLFLAVVGGLLGWAGFHKFFPKDSAAPDSPPAETQEPPPPPKGEAPPAGKSRQPIFDRNLTALAVSFKQASVYLSPIELQEGQRPIERLADILGLKAEKLRADVTTARKFVWLKRNLDEATAQKIAAAKLSGVFQVDEEHRFYPFHDHAAHVVGFEKEDQGLAGAEFLYNSILRGDRTLASQSLNLPGISPTDIPVTGAAVVVTIDIDLQTLLEKKLQLLMQQTRSQSASAVLMEATSGDILALANLPAYDPNIYWKAAGSAHQNRIVSETTPLSGFSAFVKAGAELAAGNVPAEFAAGEEEVERVITPRAVKIAKGDTAIPATKESQVWQPGVHLSPPFQWSLAYTAKAEQVNDYCRRLGFTTAGSGLGETRLGGGADKVERSEPCRLDDPKWQLMPLSILAAFAQMTNGGRAVQPHLLKGLWRMEDASLHELAFPKGDGIGSQAATLFTGFLEGLEPPGPGEALLIESIRSIKRLTGVVQAKVSDEEPDSAIENAFRFSTTTLGSGRQGDHQLAVLIMLDGARMNLSLPSPGRKAAAELISQGQGLMAKRWEAKAKPPRLEPDSVLYKRWAESQTLDSPSRPSANLESMEMPDLVGLSLRKAMQTMQGYNLKITIQGSGKVVRQTPTAGAKLKDVEEVRIELRQDKP